jgi:tripartite-type tricarboxylate transporter receptor subunit TctC
MCLFKKEIILKRLLTILLATLAITAHAKENITIVYSWGPGDAAANFYRTLAEASNKQQNKYNFLVDFKPGAGGAVAAKYVDNTPDTVLANSSALFIRPIFFPADSHEVASFRSLMPMCIAPMFITSTKYKSWAEVPTDKSLSIGISGLGSTTHLVAAQVTKKYPNIIIVPFKSTSDALMSVLSGNTDFAVSFAGDVDSWIQPNATKRVYLLGVTGKQSVKGAPTLASQGFSQATLDTSAYQQLFASIKMSDTKVKEIRSIFVKAAQTKLVKDSNAVDSCIPNSNMPDSDIDAWFNFQNVKWKQVASGVKIDK